MRPYGGPPAHHHALRPGPDQPRSARYLNRRHLHRRGNPLSLPALARQADDWAGPGRLLAMWCEIRPPLTVLGMRGDEKRVVNAFVAWLQAAGWTVQTEVNFVDVCAQRGDERLYAEAKGRTSSVGLDIDTLYGQLLRRMADPGISARYAVVVPTAAVQAALRVPAWVRQRLSIDVYEVNDVDQVYLKQ